MTPSAPPPSDWVERTRTGELEELRRLLFAREVEELAELRERLEDLRRRAQDVGAVLPEALRAAPDQQLDDALGPTMERALHRSVRKDPKSLADAIFPVLGPAIRKAIAQTLSGMIQAFNKAVEHSLSIQGLKWRLESIRTGVPFGEIVLRHSLVYRVEQVFLIHYETGLLLHHAAIDVEETRDPDMVSSMMTAVRDFVADSFSREGEGRQTVGVITIGERVVKAEQGPHAVIAVVVRGHAPNSLQLRLQDALETIHLRFGSELEEFEGDAAPFEGTHDILEALLVEQLDEAATKTRVLSPAFVAAVALVVLAVGAWGILRGLETRRWNRAVETLRAEPGLVIVDAQRHRVRGLRDPDARDPAAILSAAGYDSSTVQATWSAFLSFDSSLVAARVRRLLAPPRTADLRYENGVLAATGAAPRTWVDRARQLAATIPGVAAVDFHALTDADSAAAVAAGTALDTLIVQFDPGSAVLGAAARRTIDDAVAVIEHAAELVGPGRLRLAVLGRADPTGDPSWNQELSGIRAEGVQRQLARRLGAVGRITTRGLGTTSPLSAPDPEVAARLNRSAQIRLTVVAAGGSVQ